MENEERIWPDVAIPPGEFLAETLEEMGVSQAELARRAGRPVQVISEIVQGKKEITPETALQFERVLGTPAYVWIGLEKDYRFTKARIEDQGYLKAQVPLARQYPYDEMQDLGWVTRTSDDVARVANLLRFFAVASLDQVPDATHAAAYRKSARRDASVGALAAWLRKGEIEASKLKTGPFSAADLRDMIPTFRAMTSHAPEQFEPALEVGLARVGVALVILRHLKATHANGATKWIGDKAVVQMSLRYKWHDIFWFTFFHELGHVLLHGRRNVFVEVDGRQMNAQEAEADRFAADHLIPPVAFRRLTTGRSHYSQALVEGFAAEIGIHPGIVIGRLQHEGKLPRSHLNGLRSRFRWADEHPPAGIA
jgi:addiction module HigA family antidote